MKTKWMKMTTIFLTIFLAGTLAWAQPPKPKGMPMMKSQHFGMMQKMLDLTDDQIDQMKQLNLDRTKEFLPLRNEMAVLKARYHALVTAEKPDQKSINANIDKQTDLMNKMMKLRAKYSLKMRDILTEEQWLLIQSHKSMMKKGMSMRGKSGMQGGMGPCGKGMRGPGPAMGPGGRPGMFNEDIDIEK